MNDERKSLYAAVWRWHFYAGLFTAPFLVLLAATGLVMLFAGQVERWQYPRLTRSGPAAVSHQARLDAAVAALPGAKLVRYRPGGAPGEPTRVEVERAGTPHTIYVDEATGRVLGHVETGRRLDVLAEKIHGTLLLGDLGDRLIETAAGFGILLIVSGLYLWWPRRGPWRHALAAPALRSPRSPTSRPFWRDLHRLVGFVLAPVLLFYLVSGLAWTGVWGERLVQAWGTFPAEKWGPAEKGHDHAALDGGAHKAVPWTLEQTPLPAAPPGPGAGRRLSLDEAIAAARRAGIGPRFWVGAPEGRDDLWTVAQTGLSGEITDPRDELTVHVDRRTGRVLGRAGWSDYGPGARAMAAGIPLHMGRLGGWNTAGAALVCLLVLLLAVSGPVMWWLRRPAHAARLAAPPAPARVPKAAWAALLLLSLAFPLTMLAIAAVALADWLFVRWLPRLRAALN